MKTATYLKITIIGTLLLLIGFAGINIYIDPLFHYHAPTEGIEYPLWDERYMNDGIVRNFEYDAILTGTSMTQNFKPSQFDAHYGTTMVKVPFAGGSYKEINRLLQRAFAENDNIRYVVRGLDLTGLIRDKDMWTHEDYPDYLYDDNIWNDVEYVLNKDIYFTFTEYVFTFMDVGGKSSTFDIYQNWAWNYEYNANAMKESWERDERVEEENPLTEEDIQIIVENMEQNVLDLVKEYPETKFYFFIPPYSICYWDSLVRNGELDKVIDAQQLQIELLLEYPNVKVFSFFDEIDIICNLGYYKDAIHYNQYVTDFIMESMINGENLITEENYMEYIDYIRTFYSCFDYDTFFTIE